MSEWISSRTPPGRRNAGAQLEHRRAARHRLLAGRARELPGVREGTEHAGEDHQPHARGLSSPAPVQTPPHRTADGGGAAALTPLSAEALRAVFDAATP